MPPKRNLLVTVPSIRTPITRSPGFAKKDLSTWKADLMALCGFGCRYCSSNTGNYLRINREPFARAALAQLGRRVTPLDTPELALVYDDVLEKIERQITSHGPSWGAGETLVLSMLTDAFSGPPLDSGLTRIVLGMLLGRTSLRIRILTKNSTVGLSIFWRDFFVKWKERVVVGLSMGTRDAGWARRVEIGTPPPAARAAATRALQDAGVPTFGMLCPIFPDALPELAELVASIVPSACETVWAEPFNDRDNWRSVRDGYDRSSYGWEWLTAIFERGSVAAWSSYATNLYLRLVELAREGGWLPKLKYLLQDGKNEETGLSRHAGFANLQRAAAAAAASR